MDEDMLLELFAHENLNAYTEILRECDTLLLDNSNDAVLYYYRAMAKLGITLHQEFNNMHLMQAIPAGTSYVFGTMSPLFSFRKRIDKIGEHFKLADSALEDYNKAVQLKNNIREEYNIKVKTKSDFTNTVYCFYRPVSSKELVCLLAANRKYTIVGIGVAFLLILPFILNYFLDGLSENLSTKSMIIWIVYGLFLVLFVLFADNNDKAILRKYKRDIVIEKI